MLILHIMYINNYNCYYLCGKIIFEIYFGGGIIMMAVGNGNNNYKCINIKQK